MDTTAEDLHAAYTRSGLYRLGWTFERAMQTHAIRTALTGMVTAMHRRQAEQASATTQQKLF